MAEQRSARPRRPSRHRARPLRHRARPSHPSRRQRLSALKRPSRGERLLAPELTGCPGEYHPVLLSCCFINSRQYERHMQCNWSKTTSFLLRNYQAKISIRSYANYRFPFTQLTPRAGRCTTSPGGFLSHWRSFRGLATAATTPVSHGGNIQASEPEDITASIRDTSAGLSAAQVSRAAAQAVRLSIQEGNYGDALYVVNSACHSVLQGPLDGAAPRASQLQPIQFGCAVSPRLSAHSFLHGLIRAGYAKKAET